ncbi:helix-turn-helix transcriptional regulator [Chelatococcus sp. SYSU_G07232]|uniref:Helix-turn-helix transcriptional regulator n=1 Tax=Chelatococcus albus TaxID=3047466 RepID=A0ABT7ADC6_9HYPH|nr:helix-turn-helix transcriptional regulator [Chelatococcus sp. SYSU_G07232]MDJ1157381.1 helix-turn-helix transcriptional regulator [Chelatococcus sp. SYSU_G07232]
MQRWADPADHHATALPVAAVAKPFPADHHIAPHSHGRAQLLHAISGVMRVTTDTSAWIVPPGRAVWLPAGTVHAVDIRGPLAMRTLYIEEGAHPGLPADCTIISVGPLLRELILAATEEPADYDPAGRGGHLAALILGEIARAERSPLRIPMPRDARLVALARELIVDPGRTDRLEDWAVRLGASPRTLARLFRRETGMSFVAFREQVRLAAVERLTAGEPLARVARALGYASRSAFGAMMRRALGLTPGELARRVRE